MPGFSRRSEVPRRTTVPVLIVDDDPDAREHLTNLVESAGFPVLAAADGVEALELFRRCGPGIVIADIRMPKMDGLELLERIKDLAPRTRVILMSARGDSRTYFKAKERGAERFLLKPFPNDEILGSLAAPAD